jgi:hypothetical protein
MNPNKALWKKGDFIHSHNKGPTRDATSIPATFLRVTVAVNRPPRAKADLISWRRGAPAQPARGSHVLEANWEEFK